MDLGDNWKIESGDQNVALFKKSTKKGAKNPWAVEGYYATVKGALKGLVNQEIRDTEIKDLQTVSDKIDELYALIDGLSV